MIKKEIADAFHVNYCYLLFAIRGFLCSLFVSFLSMVFVCALIISMFRDSDKISRNKIMKNVSAFVLSWSRATLSFIL